MATTGRPRGRRGHHKERGGGRGCGREHVDVERPYSRSLLLVQHEGPVLGLPRPFVGAVLHAHAGGAGLLSCLLVCTNEVRGILYLSCWRV
ncbi:hypothetical protein [Streptomyces decoyicus]|uniref:hypothetical protein n=1 Tax=Streptomyces decoyicus TaxID=249567 RepID=UPI0033A66FFE